MDAIQTAIIIIAIVTVLVLAVVSGLQYSGGPFLRRRRPDPLLTACLGDHARADRLVRYEMRRAPGISETEARARAFERLYQDRNC